MIPQFLASPLAKWAALAGAVVIAMLVFRFVWLPAHDRAIRAEYLVELTAAAVKERDKASARATVKQEIRNDRFETSQRELANASDPDQWAQRLREQQCAAGKIAAPC